MNNNNNNNNNNNIVTDTKYEKLKTVDWSVFNVWHFTLIAISLFNLNFNQKLHEFFKYDAI